MTRTEVGRRRNGLSKAVALVLATGTAGLNADVDLADLGAGGFQIVGIAEEDRLGVSVSGAGDINGDGVADIIVGARGADAGGRENAGASYVVFGGARTGTVDLATLGDDGFVIEGAAEDDGSGRSVSGAGDVNGDGLADLIVGARDADPGGESRAGSSYVVFGKADSSPVDLGALGAGGFQIDGVDMYDNSGVSVSGAGDVNGDGMSDLIIGASRANPGGGDETGASYVIFGKADGGLVDLSALGTGGFQIDGVVASDSTGHSVSGAGDVNGDGLADLIVGAFGVMRDGTEFRAGAGFVVFGKSDNGSVDLAALGSGGFRIDGAAELHLAGDSVAGAGDVNGDGLADLIVGAPGADPDGRMYAGSSYVVFGKTDGNSVDLGALGAGGFRMDGQYSSDRLGRGVSGAGDVNGDGFADVIVGAPRAFFDDEYNAGISYLVYGKASNETVNVGALDGSGFMILGFIEDDESGDSVSGAGDVNGDGLADVIVGATGVDRGRDDEVGAGYVIFSTDTPPASATYRGNARNGDAPRLAVGTSGDGSNHSSPDARVWIDFQNGQSAAAESSTQEVTLNRSAAPFGEAAATVHWQLQTNRTDWSGAELTFRYTDAELSSPNEIDLQLVHAPASTGPYTPLDSVVNVADNTITTVVDELGFFFIGEVPSNSDLIFADGFE